MDGCLMCGCATCGTSHNGWPRPTRAECIAAGGCEVLVSVLWAAPCPFCCYPPPSPASGGSQEACRSSGDGPTRLRRCTAAPLWENAVMSFGLLWVACAVYQFWAPLCVSVLSVQAVVGFTADAKNDQTSSQGRSGDSLGSGWAPEAC